MENAWIVTLNGREFLGDSRRMWTAVDGTLYYGLLEIHSVTKRLS